ncbi:MAG: guanylate kinase [Bacteroidales bacterium]|nr:guanylate kinase [Candidatus Sodaliphilus fimicaballi]
METGKLIIISAPSGTGMSTIINSIIDDERLKLEFSVSATTRSPRDGEKDGVSYYFLTVERFKELIAEDAFAEYEEEYEGRYYGTLKSEIERINNVGKNVILDVDVLGGINVKKLYGTHALSIFIQPPSVEVLKQRLLARATDSIEEIEKRISKAEFEISHADKFDRKVINDKLETAVSDVRNLILDFVTKN